MSDILEQLENRTNQTWLRVRLAAASEIRTLRAQVATLTAENEALMERCIRSENEMYRATEERDSLKAWKAEAEGQEPVGYVPLGAISDLADARACKQNLSYRYIFAGQTVDGFGAAAPVYLNPTAASIERAIQEERERLGKLIHYPECWNTACYRTLEDALTEIGCSCPPRPSSTKGEG